MLFVCCPKTLSSLILTVVITVVSSLSSYYCSPVLEKVTLSVRKLNLVDYETYHYEKDRLKQVCKFHDLLSSTEFNSLSSGDSIRCFNCSFSIYLRSSLEFKNRRHQNILSSNLQVPCSLCLSIHLFSSVSIPVMHALPLSRIT